MVNCRASARRRWKSFKKPSATTPRFAVVQAKTDWSRVAEQLGLPLIIKPAREGSTIGISKVSVVKELPTAYDMAARYDSLVMADFATTDCKAITIALNNLVNTVD